MVIQKIFNNNAATILNDNGKECVVIGKGIAFGKKAGDVIDETHAVKIFKSAGHGLAEKISGIVENIPFEHVKLCNEIVEMARRELGDVDDKIFLTLVDHISFAVERHKRGMEFANTLWEIQKLYPNEYRVGLIALDITEHRLGVRLPASEATFIAFHFLNANGTSMRNAKKSVTLIQGVRDIVRRYYDGTIDENSERFTRFMTHLRFFAGRILDHTSKSLQPEQENKLLMRLLDDMSVEKSCVDEIAAYVKETFGYDVSQDEKSYLMIHVHRILCETR